jgi:hypothetical protein
MGFFWASQINLVRVYFTWQYACSRHYFSARWRPAEITAYDLHQQDLTSASITASAKCALSFYSRSFLRFNVDSFFSGVGVNKLAMLGLQEATGLWPTKNLDIFVVLNSGFPKSERASWKRDFEDILNTLPQTTPTVFRLEPDLRVNSRLDDCERLTQISEDTIMWLAQRREYMVALSNHLIAGLFFYTVSSMPNASNQFGEISCRLPWDLEARETMVTHLINVAHRRSLFSVTKKGARIEIDALPALKQLCRGQNLIIEVDLEDVCADGPGEIKLSILMADLFGDSDNRYPISGTPYKVPHLH